MLVYRIEGASRNGPYVDYNCHVVLTKHSFGYNNKVHPGPYRDINNKKLRELDGAEYYACNSIEQLMTWWHNDRVNLDLEKAKANIVVYSVPDKYVAIGNKQVAFIKKRSKKVDTIKISDVVSALYYENM